MPYDTASRGGDAAAKKIGRAFISRGVPAARRFADPINCVA